MNNIEKLLCGRNAIDKYKEVIKIKGTKSDRDIKDLNTAMEQIGMDKKTFYLFNTAQNFAEADRCFRFRKTGNPDEIAICDNCVGRCNIKCYEPTDELRKKFLGGCTANGIDFINSLNYLTPNSLYIEEQKAKLQNLGLSVDDYYISTPTAIFITHDFNFTFPDFCVGFGYKIIEPRFDIFWGMEKFYDLGHNIYNAMLESKI